MKVEYDKKYCQEVIEFMSSGYTLTAFAAKNNISFWKLSKWKKEHEEFKEACDMGHGKAQLYFENLLLAGVVGKSEVKDKNGKNVRIKISPSLIIFTLKTRFHKEFQEVIHIGDTKGIIDLTPQQKIKIGERLMRKAKKEVERDTGTNAKEDDK